MQIFIQIPALYLLTLMKSCALFVIKDTCIENLITFQGISICTKKLLGYIQSRDLAGGSTVSESTQAVVIPDESFTLYVAETDAEGNLVGGTDGFRYTVTVENGNVLFDENNLNAEVTIINKEQPEATPTVTPEETKTPTPIPGTSTGVKTGDDTPIGFYMSLLFVAALAIEETTRRRRKKEQD